MITLELYKRNWNTHYIQYNPTKWVVDFKPLGDHLNIQAMTIDAETKKSYGPFDGVSIRNSSIPTYVSKSDIEVWD